MPDLSGVVKRLNERYDTMDVVDKFDKVELYCITTPPKAGQAYEEMVEAAAAGGVDAIQFRDKTLSPSTLVSIGKNLKEICRKHGIVFIINDRPDVALACDADGVHIGQDDVPVATARRILGPEKIVGKSAHSLEQALKAQSEGASYVSCGPVYSTPTKPDYPSVGLELVREYINSGNLKIPFVAIGGIDKNNVAEVIKAGAKSVAVVRAICGQENIKEAAVEFKELIKKAKNTLVNSPESIVN